MRLRLLCTLVLGALLNAQTAAFTPFGVGCQRQRSSFFQTFNTGTFDLSGTTTSPGGWSMINLGEGWLVLPLVTTWRQPVSPTVISMGDDVVTSGQPLGFTMPTPTGPLSNVWIGSNGFVYLDVDTNANCCAGDAAVMCAGSPRVAGCWMDLNPSGTSSISIDRSNEDGGSAWVTFNAVPEYSSSGTVTFQILFRAFGQIDVMYGPCSNAGHVALAGYSPGRGALTPGVMDLGDTIQQTLVTGPDMDPLQLGSTARPRIGTTMPITVSSVPTAAPFLWLAIGTQGFSGGVDLSGAGMYFCSQYAGLDSAVGVARSGTTANWNLVVPNLTGLLGQHAFVQALAVAPTVNPVGLIASNGADLLVGSN